MPTRHVSPPANMLHVPAAVCGTSRPHRPSHNITVRSGSDQAPLPLVRPGTSFPHPTHFRSHNTNGVPHGGALLATRPEPFCYDFHKPVQRARGYRRDEKQRMRPDHSLTAKIMNRFDRRMPCTILPPGVSPARYRAVLVTWRLEAITKWRARVPARRRNKARIILLRLLTAAPASTPPSHPAGKTPSEPLAPLLIAA